MRPTADPHHPNNRLVTPPWFLDTVRASFGSEIIFDPASSSLANELVRAQWFGSLEPGATRAEDWPQWISPATWCNPPYGWGLCWPFIDRLVRELEADTNGGRLQLLTNWDHSTKWCKRLLACDKLTPVFLFERVRYHHPETLEITARKGEKCQVVWVSDGCDLKPWAVFGSIWERIHVSPPEVTP